MSLDGTAVDFGKYQYAWTGVSLILTAVFNPEGILGAWHQGVARARASIRRAARPPLPPDSERSGAAGQQLEDVNG